jgi:hypothetical protein
VSRSLLALVPPGVYVMEHDADAVVPVRVHVPPNVPLPLVVSVTTPVGVMNVPGEVSVTVTVQIIAAPMIADDGQDIEEDRVLTFTLIVTVAFGFAA